MKIVNLFLMVVSVGLLSACQEKITYDYLMQHPYVLKEKYDACRIQSAPDCQLVERAASDMMAIIKRIQDDPEKFGEYILELQSAHQATVVLLSHLSEQMETLRSKRATPAEISSTQLQHALLLKRSQSEEARLAIFLAILGINSPE